MKRKLITRLILAGLAGVAVTGAYAGQIQASSVSIAREAIVSNTQPVRSPSISYRFAGDIDARSQAQTFQIQFSLVSGTWSTLPAGINNQIAVADGVSGAEMALNIDYSIVASGISADGRTMWATISVPQAATRLMKQPIFTLNKVAATTNSAFGGGPAPVPGVNVDADKASVLGLRTVVGDVTTDFDAPAGNCTAVRTAQVTFQHFVALSNPSAFAVNGSNGVADEHVRSGHTSQATLMTFPTNLRVVFAPSTGTLRLQSGGNQTFDSSASGAFVASANPSTPGTAHVAAPATNQTIARLGIARLVQNAAGLDSDVTNTYALNNTGGVLQAATATLNNGKVEFASFGVAVSASNGFVVGGNLFLSPVGTNCAASIGGNGIVPITAANAAGPITVTVDNGNNGAFPGQFGAAGTNAMEVCYQVPGTATVPSSAFTVVGTLVKSAAGGNFAEQNNRCSGTLFSLGGGLKIDVRNYASSAEAGAGGSGYMSVLRFVNNSDTRTADVWAQFIHQDGTLGNWGKLFDMSPRSARNMTAAQIDAILAQTGSAPSAATAAVNGVAAPTAMAAVTTGAVAAQRSDTSPRLRITSTSGSTLRVQNYLFNRATGQILEASASQGVDFEGSNDRAPASEGQYQDQDALSGLNLR